MRRCASVKLLMMAVCLAIPLGIGATTAEAALLKCSTGVADKGATDATAKEEIRWLPTMLAVNGLVLSAEV